MSQFTAIGLAPLPDIETARRNYGLHDLSDEDVGKVLFHRRKQGRGDDALAWDQQCIGAVSLLRLGPDQAHIETLGLREVPELMLLDAVFRAMESAPPLVSWNGRRELLPLLRFRCLKHRRRGHDPLDDAGELPHVDLRQVLLGEEAVEAPDLHAMAQRLFLPGMNGHRADVLWERWLARDDEALAAYADYQAVNTALLALEIFHLDGRYSLDDVERRRAALRTLLEQAEPAARYRPLLARWEGDS
jgi:predicted PolB exonuclease-like 3'-5' exonuclease